MLCRRRFPGKATSVVETGTVDSVGGSAGVDVGVGGAGWETFVAYGRGLVSEWRRSRIRQRLPPRDQNVQRASSGNKVKEGFAGWDDQTDLEGRATEWTRG